MPLSSPLTRAIHLVAPGQPDEAAEALRVDYLVNQMGYFNSPAQLSDAFRAQAGYVTVQGGDGRCLGLMRIIHAGAAGFELQRYLDPADYAPVSERTIEVAEFIVAAGQRASSVPLQLGLGFARYLQNHQPDTLISLSTRETASHYARLGMTVRWDLQYRAKDWGTDVWFCFAHPASRIGDAVVANTPAVYQRTVSAYLEDSGELETARP